MGTAIVFHDALGHVREVRMVEDADLARQAALDRDCAKIDVSHEDALRMHGEGYGTFRVDAGRVVKKTRVTLKAAAATLVADGNHANVEHGDTLVVSHDGPEPVKLWVDLQPVAGAHAGKCHGDGHSFIASRLGVFKLHLRDPLYYADPIEIRVRAKPTETHDG